MVDYHTIVWGIFLALGVPVFAGMLIFQVLVAIVAIIILAAIKASDKVVTLVTLLAVYGIGWSVVATPLGWFVLLAEHAIGISAYAMNKNYTVKTPLHVQAYSIGPDGEEVHISAKSGTFVGPGQFAPDNSGLVDKTLIAAARMAGHNPKDYPALRDSSDN